MHRPVRRALTLGIALAAALLALALARPAAAAAQLAPDTACAAVVEPREALRRVYRDGQLVDSALVPVPDRLPAAWRSPAFRLAYTVHVGDCSKPSVRRAVLLFRAGGPYRVTGNGAELEPLRQGARETAPYNGRVGGVFEIGPGVTDVDVELLTMPNVSAGLIRVAAGPQVPLLAGAAQPHFRWHQFVLVTGALLAMVGVFSVLITATRRFDPPVFWFGAVCILFAARSHMLETFGIALDPFLFEQINPLLLWVSSLLVTTSTLWLTGAMTRRRGMILLAMVPAAVAGFVASLALPGFAGSYRSLAIGFGFALLIVMFGLLVARRAWLGRAYAAWLLLGYACVMVGGAHDMLMIVGLLPAGWWTLLTPGFALLLLCHTVVVGLYLLRSLKRAETANLELESAIRAKMNDLQQSYSARQAMELERAGDQARAAERERLLRDMHDGLGAQLMTALRAVERGTLGPADLARSLQDGLDELRLLMDSTDLGHYLPAALAAWRNRWDARLLAAGVALEWNVDESLDAVQLSSEAALQVMRILQEAAANIVKHSQARHMKLDARVASMALLIEITDDGIGIPQDATRPGSRGLKNMRYRAEQIGAQLAVGPREPRGPGTRVLLSVPLANLQTTNPRLAASTAASARDEIPSLR